MKREAPELVPFYDLEAASVPVEAYFVTHHVAGPTNSFDLYFIMEHRIGADGNDVAHGVAGSVLVLYHKGETYLIGTVLKGSFTHDIVD